ncbi:hypothetical protein NFI96_025571 [Prochilodus magdalenae]|nr:hypothetical protein NFI96_025571 [Prochilodus magdalenae]
MWPVSELYLKSEVYSVKRKGDCTVPCGAPVLLTTVPDVQSFSFPQEFLQALEVIRNNPRSKLPARIERWGLRFQPYDLRVVYRKGAENPADYISRHPVQAQTGKHTRATKVAEEYVNFLAQHVMPKAMTLAEIKEETLTDQVLQKHTQVKFCYAVPGYGVIPSALEDRALQLAHEGHQGIVKTTSAQVKDTPHSTTEASPAELVFQRKIHTKIPTISNVVENNRDHIIKERDRTAKARMKLNADIRHHAKPSTLKLGDTVLHRQPKYSKLTTPYNNDPHTVIHINGSMVTARSNEHSITRNPFFKKINADAQHFAPDPGSEDENTTIPSPRYPHRYKEKTCEDTE